MDRKQRINWALGWPSILTLGVLLAIAGVMHGERIDWTTQEKLYEGLRNTAAIIFGVMGAWIAIVYPRSLSHLLQRNDEPSEKDVRRVKMLLLPMLVSTIILATMLLGAPLMALLQKLDYFMDRQGILRRVSFSALLVLTLVQFWALLYTLVPLGMAEGDVSNAGEQKDRERRLTSLQQKRSSPRKGK